jgi:hypothetical protein
MSTPARKPRSAAAERQAAYRRRMRDAGFRQKTMWVLDLRRPDVRERLEREIKAIAEHDPDGDTWMRDLYAVDDWPKE